MRRTTAVLGAVPSLFTPNQPREADPVTVVPVTPDQPEPAAAALTPPQPAPLPPDPQGLSDENIRARYGWAVPPPQGWPSPPNVVAAVLGIPQDLLGRMTAVMEQAAPSEQATTPAESAEQPPPSGSDIKP